MIRFMLGVWLFFELLGILVGLIGFLVAMFLLSRGIL